MDKKISLNTHFINYYLIFRIILGLIGSTNYVINDLINIYITGKRLLILSLYRFYVIRFLHHCVFVCFLKQTAIFLLIGNIFVLHNIFSLLSLNCYDLKVLDDNGLISFRFHLEILCNNLNTS